MKTSSCSPRAPNLLHVLPSRMVGWNKLCNPASGIIFVTIIIITTIIMIIKVYFYSPLLFSAPMVQFILAKFRRPGSAYEFFWHYLTSRFWHLTSCLVSYILTAQRFKLGQKPNCESMLYHYSPPLFSVSQLLHLQACTSDAQARHQARAAHPIYFPKLSCRKYAPAWVGGSHEDRFMEDLLVLHCSKSAPLPQENKLNWLWIVLCLSDFQS